MLKFNLPDENDPASKLTPEELRNILNPQYPPTKTPIDPKLVRLLESAMVGAMGAYLSTGTVHPLFMNFDEDNLNINAIQGFNRETADTVARLLHDSKEKYGAIVFVDEIYFVGVSREYYDQHGLHLKDLNKLPQRREGVMVRLMTTEYEVAWMNEIVNKKLTGWKLIMDTRDPKCKSLPLDIPAGCPTANKNLLTPSEDEQSFAN